MRLALFIIRKNKANEICSGNFQVFLFFIAIIQFDCCVKSVCKYTKKSIYAYNN